MLIASIPTRISTPFANSAGAGDTRPIPIPSQIGIEAGAASFETGFPPDTFLPIGAGGTPPWGADFNGLLNQMTAWLRWAQAGAPIAYDATFQTDIGGYPEGAIVRSAVYPGLYWCSLTDGNTTNPDAAGAGWLPIPIASGGILTTGAWTWRPTQEDIPGWTKANGTTIGSASSGATQLASDVLPYYQFQWYWNNFSNSLCPVSSGRGANAVADFNANKTITTINMCGTFPMGMDTMGGVPTTRLAGVPATIGSATQAGSFLGEVLHQLSIAELATHGHTITDPGHGHTITDPGHIHAITDAGHFHVAPNAGLSVGVTYSIAGGTGIGPAGANTSTNTTGITINSHATGVTINNNATGVTVDNNGSNTAHNNTGFCVTGTHYFKL